jgi:hypothetical protein
MAHPSERPAPRRTTTLVRVGSAVAVLLALTACGGPSVGSSAPSTSANIDEVAQPTGLQIPAIGVDVSDLQSLANGSSNDNGGSDSRNDDECPRDPQAIAWNSSGTLPGEPGLALMVGSTKGVFQRLSKLGPNDAVIVKRADGTSATFKKTDPSKTTPGARTARLQLTGCGGQTTVNVYAQLAP